MTLKELEARVEALEEAVRKLQPQPAATDPNPVHWWHTNAGRFANDPVFDEIVRLGREYRESLHPDYKKKKKKKRAKKRARHADT